MKKYLFFDIDGTLFDNKNNVVPASTVKAIKKLSENEDIIMFLCSGRAPFYINDILEIYPYFKGSIFLNGHNITYNNETLRNNVFSKAEMNSILTVLEKHKLTIGYQSVTTEKINSNKDEHINLFIELNMNVPIYLENFNNVTDASQMYFFADEKLSKTISKELPMFDIVHWGKNGADILSKGISKYEAITFIKNTFSLKEDQLYAFGDGTNDTTMLKNIKNSACMGQGAAESKLAASFVSTDVSNDGLSNAIKHFNLINEDPVNNFV